MPGIGSTFSGEIAGVGQRAGVQAIVGSPDGQKIALGKIGDAVPPPGGSVEDEYIPPRAAMKDIRSLPALEMIGIAAAPQHVAALAPL